MESLIIFAIIAIISSLFGKDKKQPQKQQPKPSKQQMPPFGQPTIPEKSNPVPGMQRPAAKSLEDFANEIFGQLNEKFEEQKPQPRKTITVAPPVDIQPIEQKVEKNVSNAERRSERPPLYERPITVKYKDSSMPNFVPKSRKDLVQGLVMAEVLGPPKAKRK